MNTVGLKRKDEYEYIQTTNSKLNKKTVYLNLESINQYLFNTFEVQKDRFGTLLLSDKQEYVHNTIVDSSGEYTDNYEYDFKFKAKSSIIIKAKIQKVSKYSPKIFI